MHIVPYEYLDAERLRFGRYPVLDAILYRWMRRIEETLFERAGVEVYAGASVFEEMKFATFYGTLRRPRPIYFFALEPLPGTGLFVVDNRFSAFCLRQDAPRAAAGGAGQGSAGQAGAAPGAATLTPANQARLQRVVQELLADFGRCWADVEAVQPRLRKITTYPFRARILNPYENCLVAQIHLAGHHISSRLTWCLPVPMLEPLLERLRERRVIPPVQLPAGGAGHPSEATVLRWLNYGVQVRVGQLSIADAIERLEVGAVMPLQGAASGEAVVEVEGTPVLRASLGDVGGRYAFRVEGALAPPEPAVLADPTRFRPLRWREASSD